MITAGWYIIWSKNIKILYKNIYCNLNFSNGSVDTVLQYQIGTEEPNLGLRDVITQPKLLRFKNLD